MSIRRAFHIFSFILFIPCVITLSCGDEDTGLEPSDTFDQLTQCFTICMEDFMTIGDGFVIILKAVDQAATPPSGYTYIPPDSLDPTSFSFSVDLLGDSDAESEGVPRSVSRAKEEGGKKNRWQCPRRT